VSGYGLQINNADGSLGFTASDRLTRVLGIVRIGGPGNTTGSVSSAGFSTGTPFWIINSGGTDYNTSNTTINYPDFTMSGNTLSWTIPNTAYYQLIYGVY
jgi:hypothetical protein